MQNTTQNILEKLEKNCAEDQIQVCCRRVAAWLAKNAENSLSAHHLSL